MGLREIVIQGFEERFRRSPDFLVRAPGRVNLIGEHTDYNDGFVMPMAIDRAMWIAVGPRTDQRVVGHSLDLDQTVDVPEAVLLAAHVLGGTEIGHHVEGAYQIRTIDILAEIDHQSAILAVEVQRHVVDADRLEVPLGGHPLDPLTVRLERPVRQDLGYPLQRLIAQLAET